MLTIFFKSSYLLQKSIFTKENGNKSQPIDELVRCLYTTSQRYSPTLKRLIIFLCENYQDKHDFLSSNTGGYPAWKPSIYGEILRIDGKHCSSWVFSSQTFWKISCKGNDFFVFLRDSSEFRKFWTEDEGEGRWALSSRVKVIIGANFPDLNVETADFWDCQSLEIHKRSVKSKESVKNP